MSTILNAVTFPFFMAAVFTTIVIAYLDKVSTRPMTIGQHLRSAKFVEVATFVAPFLVVPFAVLFLYGVLMRVGPKGSARAGKGDGQ
jgi:hypothetical protein